MEADVSFLAVKAIRGAVKEALGESQGRFSEAVEGLTSKLQGYTGPQGGKGDRGLPGERGFPGKDGRDGKDGAHGKNGVDGKTWPKPLDGRDGLPGLAGKDGADGKDGEDGLGLRWRGEYQEGTEYSQNSLVLHGGSLWICLRSKVYTKPGRGSPSWDLLMVPPPPRIAGYGVVQGQGAAGSSITLQTNGVTNVSQTTLNLKNGTNITVSDDGLGGITVALSGLGAGIATFLATPSSANLLAAVTDETGTGSLVFATSPTLVTPALGTPASGVMTNVTGTAASLTAGLATDTVSKTGTGSVYATNTSPTFVTPLLGTPTSGVATNLTGTATGLTSGITNALKSATTTIDVSAAAAPTNTQVLTATSGTTATWQTPGAGALSGISAATGANTIASGNNSGQVWNWALTSDSVIAFTFGETTAATGGTSTTGVPNQVIARFSTLAGSTASPLSVWTRGNRVLDVVPTATQMFLGSGTAALPILAWHDGLGLSSGLYNADNGAVGFSWRNSTKVIFGDATGILGRPAIGIITNSDFNLAGVGGISFASTGFNWPSSGNLVLGMLAVENTRWLAGATQFSKGTADAVSYALNVRKARGTVASPTVITTGDDLYTESGYGYVGATNTYREACRITFDSTGTIADSTTGIGGIIRFANTIAGTDTAPVERYRMESAWFIATETTVNPGTGNLTSLAALAGPYMVNDKLVFAYNNAGTITYITLPLDGLTTLWTHGTAAP